MQQNVKRALLCVICILTAWLGVLIALFPLVRNVYALVSGCGIYLFINSILVLIFICLNDRFPS